MSTASDIKEKQLPAHSVSIEIYSSIARFPCDSTVLVCLYVLTWLGLLGPNLKQQCSALACTEVQVAYLSHDWFSVRLHMAKMNSRHNKVTNNRKLVK